MHCFVVFLLFSTLSTAPFVYGEGSETPNGFSSELIHRDSPRSPFYNPSKSIPELMRSAAVRSFSRVNRVSHSLSSGSPESIIIPAASEYMMRIYIGTPPVERLVYADTGSDLIWVQCSSCNNNNCFPQNTPYYNPTKSSTFTILSCESQPCTLLPPTQKYCGPQPFNQCLYSYNYNDQSFTKGALVTDHINFGLNIIPLFPNSITFGCGYHNQLVAIDPSGRNTGLVGLGAGPLSLVSQLGNYIGYKFSYCLVPFTSTTSSIIKFGKELATMSGNGVVSTPLIINSQLPYYFLNLEGVSIGQKTIYSNSYSN